MHATNGPLLHWAPNMPAGTLHYIHDPLCGWCYGIAPLIKAAAALPDVEMHLHGGCLWPRPTVLPAAVRRQIRLADARAAYGFGLETFLLGFPMHFDWSWRTTFNKTYEDVAFYLDGGSTAFRKPKFSFWIGYDW